ncbi:MAG: helix-turn-helix domain-containing protein [Gammaproteobacteria bacterium]|nr:helix-turn-helix domain-containing protein [Gammaproteobacteria bacterium]MCW8982878.1 helix-turn-helix domain-containing protein [Gammaproteobacteria bacterium]
MSDITENGQQKSELASKVGSKLLRLDLSIGSSAKRLGITQTEMTQLLRGELDGFSTEQLQGFAQELEG